MSSSVDLEVSMGSPRCGRARNSLLVSSDFSESDGTGPVPVGLLNTTRDGRGGRGLSGGLGSDCVGKGKQHEWEEWVWQMSGLMEGNGSIR
jgi:hypothetical protein